MTQPLRLAVSLLAAATLMIVLPGCAARRAEALARMPVAETVCLQVEGIAEPERGLFLRKAAAFLAETGFRAVASDCDLRIAYTSLDQGKWEVLSSSLFGLRSQTMYRVEGFVSVWGRDGQTLELDMKVNTRDYSSRADVLEALAWEVVRYVPDNYRPRTPPGK